MQVKGKEKELEVGAVEIIEPPPPQTCLPKSSTSNPFLSRTGEDERKLGIGAIAVVESHQHSQASSSDSESGTSNHFSSGAAENERQPLLSKDQGSTSGNDSKVDDGQFRKDVVHQHSINNVSPPSSSFPITAINSCNCNTIVRDIIQWYVYDPTLFKAVYRPFVKFSTPNASPKLQWLIAKFHQWFRYHVRAATLPIPSDESFYSHSRYFIALLMTNFLKGAQFFTDRVWSLALAGLIAHDWWLQESQPENRYGTTLADIWKGTAINQNNLSSSFGTDVFSDGYPYWLGMALLPTLLLSFGMFHAVLRIGGNYYPSSEQVNRYLAEELTGSNYRHPKLKQAYDWLIVPMPWSKLSRYLSRIKFKLLWDQDLPRERKRYLSKILTDFAKEGSGYSRYYSLLALADIVYSFNLNNLRLISISNNRVRAEALNTLVEVRRENSLGGFYSQYLLWTLNERDEGWSKAIIPSLLLGISTLLSLWTLYAKARLVEIVAFKAEGIADYYQAKHACESKGKIFHYISTWAKDECSYCSNLSEVNIANIKNPQACLNDYFRFSHSPQKITNLFKQFKAYPDWVEVDFSRQKIRSWSDNDFRDVLNSLQSALRGQSLQLFNLSSPEQDAIWPSIAKIEYLSVFLQNNSVLQLDVARQALGPTYIKKLLPGLQNTTSYLDFSYNRLTDEGAESLIANLPSQLKTLILTGNQLGDLTVRKLSNRLSQQKNLTHIDLGNNLFGQNGLDALGDNLPQSQVQTLNLNGNDVSNLSLQTLWQGVMQAPIENLSLAFTNLSDEQLFNGIGMINNSSLTVLDVSQNALTDVSMISLVSGLPNRPIDLLVLSGNQLSNEGLLQLIPSLAVNPIKGLDLSNCPFDKTGALPFTSAINSTLLERIYLAHNALGDEVAINLATALRQPNAALKALDMTDNQLTDRGTSSLAASPLSVLVLRDNSVGNETAKSLLSQSTLHELDISNCNVNTAFLVQFVDSLPKSQLRKLNIAVNPAIGGQGIQALARQLIAPLPPHVQTDGQEEISRDERRFLTNNVKPNTLLEEINISEVGLNDEAGRLFCRVLPGSHISFDRATLLPNRASKVNLATCQVDSSGAAHSGGVVIDLVKRSGIWQDSELPYTYLDADDWFYPAEADDMIDDEEEVYRSLRKILGPSDQYIEAFHSDRHHDTTLISTQSYFLQNSSRGNYAVLNNGNYLSSTSTSKANSSLALIVMSGPFIIYFVAISSILLLSILAIALMHHSYFNRERTIANSTSRTNISRSRYGLFALPQQPFRLKVQPDEHLENEYHTIPTLSPEIESGNDQDSVIISGSLLQ